MKTLNQIKEAYATDHEYLSWEDLVKNSTKKELDEHWNNLIKELL